MGSIPIIDLDSEEFRRNPWAEYKRIRLLGGLAECPSDGCFLAASSKLVRHLLTPAFSSHSQGRPIAHATGSEHTLANSEGHDHHKRRSAFRSWLTEANQSDICRVIRESVEELPSRGELDLISAFSAKAPPRAFATLVGLQDDMSEQLCRHVSCVVAYLDMPRDKGLYEQCKLATPEIVRLMRKSKLAAELAISDGDCVLIAAAGIETTVRALGITLAKILTHDGWAATLIRDPSKARAVVRETIRWGPPIHSISRFARVTMPLGLGVVNAGDRIMACLASANRDESLANDLDNWNPHRVSTADFSFGRDSHRCPGDMLAALEIETAVNALLRRFEVIELVQPELLQITGRIAYGLTELLVRVR